MGLPSRDGGAASVSARSANLSLRVGAFFLLWGFRDGVRLGARLLSLSVKRIMLHASSSRLAAMSALLARLVEQGCVTVLTSLVGVLFLP